ncbi:MAG: 2-(1,2-epoxy,2-dihydrophenyl)acetyl-CoA isomerase [Thermoanaerobaculia bacterium]|jgi:2-(1,2-epoxy-1,2-dihydrophenyl)acetyl-CoA isomerase|nr:2-(1,2-epoxy,2-dihydrophenyl)acetyl-CoA isomerase [Thermoanaerobaculia bacterium]
MIRSEPSDHITTITLDRPEKLNAFSGTMREDLVAALRAAGDDPTCRVVVITGAGRAFCAGGDVDYMAGLQKEGDVARFLKLLDAGRDVVTQIAEMAKPVIASVNGIAAGAGCNLALACDYRIASETAILGETFVRIGLQPDWGGTWFLPRLVGPGRALEMMMTGRMVDAAEALAIGLVDRVVAAEALADETTKLARAIAQGPPLAIAGIKRALAASRTNPLRAQLDLEGEHQTESFRSRDAGEGMAAFFEKRPPKFEGR